jgi:dihydrofolate reductase
MRVSLIAAMDNNRLIGRDNSLPWRLSADLKRFKALTMGHTLIMGRKTYESIGRPLPGRKTVIITRNEAYAVDGVDVAHSLDDAVVRAAAAHEADEAFIAGGAEIYQHALPRADRMHLTLIDASFDGDTFFPAIDDDEWTEVERVRHDDGDQQFEHGYAFVTYDRVRG